MNGHSDLSLINTIAPVKKERPFALILGGGLAGLSAGYALSKEGMRSTIIEKGATVGGLSRTVSKGDYKFDLGGHRFFTNNEETDRFVSELMADELLEVSRKSIILLNDKFFDYPLKPLNSVFGLGLGTTSHILFDYLVEKMRGIAKKPVIISLEDWVVSNFGRRMFDLYFKQYSEKVWGIDCKRIDESWVSKRIQGLSLSTAVKNAFFKMSGRQLPTLTDRFVYPKLGIGRLSDRLKLEIDKTGSVMLETTVRKINHNGRRIQSVEAQNCTRTSILTADEIISSIPLTRFIESLNPAPPKDILQTASKLKFRDIIIVAIMVDRPKVTDQSWIYIPEKNIPFGRIHEPKNWSPHMAPEDKSIMVIEYFCFKSDEIWKKPDSEISKLTVDHLEKLGFIKASEVIDYEVVRAKNAYPLFEVGYKEHMQRLLDYLSNFENLNIVGRGGLFKYYNMDHAIESGLLAAKEIIAKKPHA